MMPIIADFLCRLKKEFRVEIENQARPRLKLKRPIVSVAGR